jgi:hypothetical protein
MISKGIYIGLQRDSSLPDELICRQSIAAIGHFEHKPYLWVAARIPRDICKLGCLSRPPAYEDLTSLEREPIQFVIFSWKRICVYISFARNGNDKSSLLIQWSLSSLILGISQVNEHNLGLRPNPTQVTSIHYILYFKIDGVIISFPRFPLSNSVCITFCYSDILGHAVA